MKPEGPVWDLHILDPAQGRQKRLTNGLRVLGRHSWRPDGAFVVFKDDSSEGHGYGLIVIDVEGRGTRKLTSANERADSPAWSPDGKWIVYRSDRAGSWDIYVSSQDGTEVRRLTHDAGHDHDPEWSPDGTRLAFQRAYGRYNSRTGALFYQRSAIGVVRADGKRELLVATPRGINCSPKWSPDGTAIAYESNADGDFDVCIVGEDGSSPKRLTDNGAKDALVRWSPDGRSVLFTSADRRVHSVAVAGGAAVAVDASPTGIPSPDGKAVASTSPGQPGIIISGPDGGGAVRVTTAPVWGQQWFRAPPGPSGDRILDDDKE